jgi:hypothetical protein
LQLRNGLLHEWYVGLHHLQLFHLSPQTISLWRFCYELILWFLEMRLAKEVVLRTDGYWCACGHEAFPVP